MKLYGSEGVLLMEVEAINAADDTLQIKGKMMGQIPMRVVVKPADLREAMGMLSFGLVWTAIKMLFKR